MVVMSYPKYRSCNYQTTMLLISTQNITNLIANNGDAFIVLNVLKLMYAVCFSLNDGVAAPQTLYLAATFARNCLLCHVANSKEHCRTKTAQESWA